MTPSWRVRWAVPTALLLLVLLAGTALAALSGARGLAALLAVAVALLAVMVALLYRQLQLDAAQSQVLLRVSRDLASRLEVGELFDDIVQAIVRLVPLTGKCVIHLLDEERQKLYPRYSSQPAWQHSLGMPLGKGIAGQALQELRTMAIADVRREAGFLPLQSSSDLRALLVAPLHVQGRLLGTISLNSATPGAFTRRDEVLVTTLAAQASAALRQAQLREDAQREAHYIAALMNNLGDGLVVLDAQRRILRHNSSLAHILGPDLPALAGCSLDDPVADPALRRLAELVGPAGDPRRAVTRQVELSEPIHAIVQVSIAPIATATGEWEQIVVIHDQTDERDVIRAEADVLAAAAAELEPALSELRGYATLFQASGAPAPGDLAQVHSESARLMRLAGDLADWHSLQVGTLRLDRRPTSLAVLAADLLREMAPAAAARGVSLHLEGAPGLPPAMVDAERLHRALAGLLEDAVRRSAAGGQVALRLAASADELSAVVRDDGRPVAADERERVFRRYYHYDAEAAAAQQRDAAEQAAVECGADAATPLAAQFTPGDTGLGLYLSRRLIEAHGGHLWIPEDDGPGNALRLIVPLELPRAPRP